MIFKNTYKKTIVIFILTLALCITSCGKKGGTVHNDTSAAGDWYSKNLLRINYRKDGVLYQDNDLMLYYRAYGDAEPVCVCNKPGCTHEPYDEKTNPEPECDAYVSAGYDCVVSDSKYIYLVGYDINDYDILSIYRENMDGSDRKKVAAVKDVPLGTLYGITACSADNYIAFDYSYDDGEKVDNGFILLNTETCKAEKHKIEGAYGANKVQVSNGKVYCYIWTMDSDFDEEYYKSLSVEDYSAINYLSEHAVSMAYCYDIESGSENRVEVFDENIGFANGNVYYSDKDMTAVIEADAMTGEEKQRFSVDDGNLKYRLLFVMGQQLIVAGYDETVDQNHYKAVDLKSGKIKELGQGLSNLAIGAYDEEYIYGVYYNDKGEGDHTYVKYTLDEYIGQ